MVPSGEGADWQMQDAAARGQKQIPRTQNFEFAQRNISSRSQARRQQGKGHRCARRQRASKSDMIRDIVKRQAVANAMKANQEQKQPGGEEAQVQLRRGTGLSPAPRVE